MAKVRNEKDRHRKTKPIFVKFDWLRIAFFSEADAGSREENASKIEQAAAYRGNDFGLTANNPPFGPGRGQIRNC